jgi:rhodanese-related sulfurtransferase
MADPRLKDAEIVWVDSRSRSDYEREHASGAILLNKDEWDNLLASLFDAWSPGKSIVVYCTPDCHASSEIADRIRDLGIEPVFFLHGGYEAWKQATK